MFYKRYWQDRPSFDLCIDAIGQNDFAPVEPRMRALEAKGVIKFGRDYVRKRGICNYAFATIELTTAGKKYLVRESSADFTMKAYEWDFGEVTGIQVMEQVKQANVQYSMVIRDVSPFAESVPSSPSPKQATFALFDDGWRVESL